MWSQLGPVTSGRPLRYFPGSVTGTRMEKPSENATAVDRVFAMLLLARVFVFEQFLLCLPLQETMLKARRRWVLLQILPPSPKDGHDIFTTLLLTLRHGNTTKMQDMSRAILARCRRHTNFFPDESNTHLFAVIDEAQCAADEHARMFRSTSGNEKRPLLHPLYRSLDNTEWFRGFILAGTGLSMKAVEDAVNSLSAKKTTANQSL